MLPRKVTRIPRVAHLSRKEEAVSTETHRPYSPEGESFNDALYDWMQRAPWLAISVAAHLVVFLILQAIPWNLFEEETETPLLTAIAAPPVPEFPEEPPPEEPPEIPELQDIDDVPEIVDTPDEIDSFDTDEPYDDTAGEADSIFDAPFQSTAFSAVIGIGGPPGGLRAGRFGGNKNRIKGGGGTQESLRAALRWLIEHQDSDGHWDGDGFMKHDPVNDTCDGAGAPNHDVGLTGLALLALLGDGHTLRHGLYRERVSKAVSWLRSQQDVETGLIGDPIGHSFLYDHAIATLALCEAYYFTRSPLLRGTCQRAVNLISRARNPYGVWRYDLPPTGDSDSSVTGWMVFALKSAKDCGLTVDPEAFTASRLWFESMTDPATGRVGYDSVGSMSSRSVGMDEFPPEAGEAMTATALLCRIFMGDDPSSEPMLVKHADLLMKKLPRWAPDEGACDMYYWYYGTYAMYQIGGSKWKAWNRELKSAVLDTQRRDGAATGSWDPVGPWGQAGGRVYSTATMALCLEVYFRYSRVAGAR
jgi:hypothetical protein